MKKLYMLIILLIIIGFLLFYKNDILYHYYIWRIGNPSQNTSIIDLKESLDIIAPKIPRLLEKTFYNNDTLPEQRFAATTALACTDKTKAKQIFYFCLKNGNNNQVANSIYGLYLLGDKIETKYILGLSNSNDDYIRFRVADYLGIVSSKEAIEVLNELSMDRNKDVRNSAKLSIKKRMGAKGLDPCR